MADLPGTESAHIARQSRVQIINYGSEFEDLWSRALDSDEAPFGDVTDLVVLWEGEVRADPSDAMLSPHLTPLDWALLYSIRACDQSGIRDQSIHIVDLTGAQFREAYAMRQRHQWLAEMPWVGLYGALSPTDLPGIRYRKGYRPLHSNADETASLLRPCWVPRPMATTPSFAPACGRWAWSSSSRAMRPSTRAGILPCRPN